MKKVNIKLNLKQRMDKIKNLLGQIEKLGFGTTTLTIHKVPILQLDKTWKVDRKFEVNIDKPFLTAHEEGQDASYPRITLFGKVEQE